MNTNERKKNRTTTGKTFVVKERLQELDILLNRVRTIGEAYAEILKPPYEWNISKRQFEKYVRLVKERRAKRINQLSFKSDYEFARTILKRQIVDAVNSDDAKTAIDAIKELNKMIGAEKIASQTLEYKEQIQISGNKIIDDETFIQFQNILTKLNE